MNKLSNPERLRALGHDLKHQSEQSDDQHAEALYKGAAIAYYDIANRIEADEDREDFLDGIESTISEWLDNAKEAAFERHEKNLRRGMDALEEIGVAPC